MSPENENLIAEAREWLKYADGTDVNETRELVTNLADALSTEDGKVERLYDAALKRLAEMSKDASETRETVERYRKALERFQINFSDDWPDDDEWIDLWSSERKDPKGRLIFCQRVQVKDFRAVCAALQPQVNDHDR